MQDVALAQDVVRVRVTPVHNDVPGSDGVEQPAPGPYNAPERQLSRSWRRNEVSVPLDVCKLSDGLRAVI